MDPLLFLPFAQPCWHGRGVLMNRVSMTQQKQMDQQKLSANPKEETSTLILQQERLCLRHGLTGSCCSCECHDVSSRVDIHCRANDGSHVVAICTHALRHLHTLGCHQSSRRCNRHGSFGGHLIWWRSRSGRCNSRQGGRHSCNRHRSMHLSILTPGGLFLLFLQILDPSTHGPPWQWSPNHAEAPAELLNPPQPKQISSPFWQKKMSRQVFHYEALNTLRVFLSLTIQLTL